MIRTVDALKLEITKLKAAHSSEITDLNKKHHIEITELLTQLEM
jgi:hypothetical protein